MSEVNLDDGSETSLCPAFIIIKLRLLACVYVVLGFIQSSLLYEIFI